MKGRETEKAMKVLAEMYAEQSSHLMADDYYHSLYTAFYPEGIHKYPDKILANSLR